MPSSTLARRASGLLATAALAGGLTACASEPALQLVPPTMAPDQSLSEACSISGEEVDRLTLEAEQQVREGLEQAASDVAEGKLPTFDFLSGPVDDTIAEVEQQITNPQLLAALAEIRTALQGFESIEQPDSALGVPAYLGSLGSQLNDLATAGKQLKELCLVGATEDASE